MPQVSRSFRNSNRPVPTCSILPEVSSQRYPGCGSEFIRRDKQRVNVSPTLGEEYVGFVEIDDGEWDVYFGPLYLGRFHERTLLIEDALGRHSRRRY